MVCHSVNYWISFDHLIRIFHPNCRALDFTKGCILRRRASRFCEECTMEASETPNHERRKRERFDIRCSVKIKGPAGTLFGETKNISPSGALITCASTEPLLPGETLELTIKRPSNLSIETSARVVWCSVPGFGRESLICWIGVRFIR